MRNTRDRGEQVTRAPFQFSLRALLIFVVVVSVISGWIGRSYLQKLEGDRAWRRFVKQVHRFQPRMLSNDDKGVSLSFEKPEEIRDADLVFLRELPKFGYTLEDVSFARSGIEGPGLVHLEAAPDLEMLDLSSTSIGDDALAFISHLHKLTYLSLYDTNVTDAGLVHLRGLTNLETLQLDKTRCSEEGIRELKKALPMRNRSSRVGRDQTIMDMRDLPKALGAAAVVVIIALYYLLRANRDRAGRGRIAWGYLLRIGLAVCVLSIVLAGSFMLARMLPTL